MDLLDHKIKEWKEFVTQEIGGPHLKLFHGDLGVGKTHFLTVFLHDLRTEHSDLSRNVILARAELTDCVNDDLLITKRNVAKAVYEDLDQRLKIAIAIREIMQREYTPGVYPPVPSCVEEMESWDGDHVNSFLAAVGRLCWPTSRINMDLGDSAPRALCIFLDNSDQLDLSVVAELHSWADAFSRDTNAMLWIFLRAETFEDLQRQYPSAPTSLRGPEPIIPPSLTDVIRKRIDTYPRRVEKQSQVRIPVGNSMVYPVKDVQAAVSYVASLAVDSADQLLVKLTEHPEASGVAPNLRCGLQAFLSILGSHVFTDTDYGEAIIHWDLLRGQNEKSPASQRSAFEKWPRILEALMLGRRIWYSSYHGGVENLLNPPDVHEHGDYLLLVHCLQALLKSRDGCSVGELCNKLAKIGYTHDRVQAGILLLSSRDPMTQEGRAGDDPLSQRFFPLVVVLPEGPTVLRDAMDVMITPWGEYHLKKLLYQAQYWKHISYRIVLPSSLIQKVGPTAVHDSTVELREQLMSMLQHLDSAEKSWLAGCKGTDLSLCGITPVMPMIMDRVTRQLE